jgi:hypothetical protein
MLAREIDHADSAAPPGGASGRDAWNSDVFPQAPSICFSVAALRTAWPPPSLLK